MSACDKKLFIQNAMDYTKIIYVAFCYIIYVSFM